MPANGSDEHRSVVSKVAAILRAVRFGGSLTVTEIAQITALPLSTVHRLVGELAGWQMLHRDAANRYTARQTPVPVASCDCPPAVRESAGSVIEDLSAAARADVRLGMLDGVRVAYVEKVHGPSPLSDFTPSATLPAHATALGKALLACSAPEVVERVIRGGLRRYTPATLTTAAGLTHALAVTRLRGVATAHDELARGHSAVAAPVIGCAGSVVAALEVRVRDVATDMTAVVPALTVAARTLSRQWQNANGLPDLAVVRPEPRWVDVALRTLAPAVPPPEDQRFGRLHVNGRGSAGAASRCAGGQS